MLNIKFSNPSSSERTHNNATSCSITEIEVIAIEGKGGTQIMLKRCKSKKFRNQGVLVKLPKKKQDFRIDLPTVGQIWGWQWFIER